MQFDLLDRTPLTARPWHILGYRKDGRPIHPIAGATEPAGGDAAGSGQTGGQAGGQGSDQTTGSAGSQTSGSGQSGDAGTGQQGGQAAGQNGGQQSGTAAERVEDLPDWAQKIVRDARKDAGDNRAAKNAAEQKQTEVLEAIAKALGLKKDEAPDPAKLAAQLTSAQNDARQAAVELAVYKAAGKHQGEPSALLDSRSFLAKVADLDPAAKDFADKVDTAIKDAVKDNPKLKAGQASTQSSVDHSGGTGERRSNQPKPLTEAVAGHYGT